jgi:hypothetical protein
MQSDVLASLRRLSDDELVTRVKDLVAGERGRMVEVVAHLAELDTRDVHFRAGHGSLFAYCRDVLGLSEQEAYNRITVARAARRYPVVLQLLEDGSLNVTAARLLVPHLTPENHMGVLEKARWKTKAQVEELAAALWPRPDAPSFVRKLPPPRPVAPQVASSPVEAAAIAASATASAAGASSPLVSSPLTSPPLASPPLPSSPLSSPPRASGLDASPLLQSAGPSSRVDDIPDRASAPPPLQQAKPHWPPPRAGEVTPLAPDRYKVQVTIGGETLEKLRLAQDLLRHAVPSGDEAVIFDRALSALLADLAQKKFAATEKPRPAGPPHNGSRTIPAEIKRRVWVRDLGRCAFVAPTGRRCTERAFLEFHHLVPYALGGEATLANIQLRCRSHNAYEARLWFGNGHGNGAGSVQEELAVYDGATRSGTSRAQERAPGPAP